MEERLLTCSIHELSVSGLSEPQITTDGADYADENRRNTSICVNLRFRQYLLDVNTNSAPIAANIIIISKQCDSYFVFFVNFVVQNISK